MLQQRRRLRIRRFLLLACVALGPRQRWNRCFDFFPLRQTTLRSSDALPFPVRWDRRRRFLGRSASRYQMRCRRRANGNTCCFVNHRARRRPSRRAWTKLRHQVIVLSFLGRSISRSILKRLSFFTRSGSTNCSASHRARRRLSGRAWTKLTNQVIFRSLRRRRGSNAPQKSLQNWST